MKAPCCHNLQRRILSRTSSGRANWHFFEPRPDAHLHNHRGRKPIPWTIPRIRICWRTRSTVSRFGIAAPQTARRQCGNRQPRFSESPGPDALPPPGGAFLRLYRQRNLVLHGGKTDGVALRASLRTAAPLVGAGMDRIAHAWYVDGLSPLELAARARISLDTVGSADSRKCVDLLGG